MANIFAPPEEKKRPNIFAAPELPRGTSAANIFAQPAAPAPSGASEAGLASLEAKATAAGAREYAPGPVGWLQRVMAQPATQAAVDVISRPNYAVAGAVQAAMKPSSEGVKGLDQGARWFAAGKRAARELLSGVGSIQGEKKAFGQVLEEAGVPAGPSLSSSVGLAVPEAFSQTGQGLPLQTGGPLDFTARGVGGFLLDVASDPLTWITGGAEEGVQALTKEGVKTFSRKGAAAVAKAVEEIAPKATIAGEKVALEALPEAGRAVALSEAQKAATETVRGRLVPPTGTLEARIAAQESFKDLSLAKGQSFKAGSKASSGAIRDLIDREAGLLTSAGIPKDSDLYRAFTRSVVDEAKERVLTAAKTSPGLLDRGGIKFAGLTLPGTPELATKATQISSKAVEALGKTPVVGSYVMKANEFGGKVYDAFGRILSRDALTKDFPYYNALKQQHLDGVHAIEAKILDGVDKSDAFSWLRKQRGEARETANRAIVRGAESGDLSALAPEARTVATELRQSMDDMGLREAGVGLLAETRPNYVPHFYDNTSQELDAIFGHAPEYQIWRGKKIDMATIGRHGEERAFDTLAEAEDFAKAVKAANPKAPTLKPVWDPIEILARRAHAHANGIGFQSWYETIAREFGEQLPYAADDIFDLTRGPMGKAKLSTAETLEYEKIKAAVDKKVGSPEFVRGLSGPGREEFFRQKLASAGTRDEVASIFAKYGEFQDSFPKLKQAGGFFDLEGKPYAEVNAGKLVGVKIPQEIAQDLSELGSRMLDAKEVGVLLRGWDKLSNTFKTWVTVAFPSFHVRNAYTNVANSFLDVGMSAFDPRLMRHTAGILLGRDGEFVTRTGARYSYSDIRDMVREMGIAQTGASMSELTGKRPLIETGIGAKVRAVGPAIENEARLQLFLNHLRRGSDPLVAAERMKSVLFDYQNLSRTEKEIFRRGIPFYTWQRKNLQFQLEQLAKHPGRMAAEIKPFRGREDEDRMMTSWESEAFKLRLNRDGKTVHVLTGIDLPIRSLDNLWRGSAEKTLSGWIGQLNPLLKVPLEVGAGKSLFTGREFSRQESGTIGRVVEHVAPKPIQQWLGYRKETDAAGKPKYTFDGERFYILFQSWAVSRIVSTSDRQFKALVQSPDSWPVFLDVMTGLRDKEIDLSEEQAKRLSERTRYVQRLLERQGELKRGEYYYKPKRRPPLR